MVRAPAPRVPVARSHDPYAVWVSEVMLQQTQASPRRAGVPLVPAPLPDGPGARGRTAPGRRARMGRSRLQPSRGPALGGRPRDRPGPRRPDPARRTTLRELPGVGPYTAAAVASIGFGEPVAVVDTNVRAWWPGCTWGSRVTRRRRGRCGRSPTRGWIATIRSRGTRRDGSRPGGVQAEPPVRRLPARARLPVPPRGSIARRGPKRQGPFEGSTRQVRGAVVNALRSNPSLTRARLAAETGFARDRIDAAIGTLVVGRTRRGRRGRGPAGRVIRRRKLTLT